MSSSDQVQAGASGAVDELDPGPGPGAGIGQVGVSVRHDVRAPAVVAVGAAVLTLVWFSRALDTGAVLDGVLTLVPAVVGLLMLAVLRDARAPLLVADDQGVRVRRGVTWTGLRWSDVDRVEVRSRRGLRDGALVLHLAAEEYAETTPLDPLDPLDPDDLDHQDQGSDPHPAATPVQVSVPLGLGTRVEVEGLTGDLVEDLASLASGLVPVVVLAEPVVPEEPAVLEPAVVEPAVPEEPEPATSVVSERLQVVVLPAGPDAPDGTDPEDLPLPSQPGPAEAPDRTGGLPDPGPVQETWGEGVAAAEAYVVGPDPERPTRDAARAEVRRDAVRRLPDAPAIPAQRTSDVEVVTARIADLQVDPGPQPASDPVIGPVIAAARQRARLSVDTLSERTRIRPHVLECLEVDDFAACGGDFYARGHLRTLARVFGLDAEQLVATYDERYAQPEIEAKQVFEAELASGIGGGVRTASSGPRWSMLAAAVLLLVGIWGTARVFSDDPQELVSPAPDVVDTAGLAGEEPEAPQPALAAIRVTAQGDSPQVVIRDGDGRILWAGELGRGQSQQVIGTGPFDVTASNGRAVQVDYLGEDRGTVGDSRAADNRRFG